jgi:K+-transporting ATPase KdpF subunit
MDWFCCCACICDSSAIGGFRNWKGTTKMNLDALLGLMLSALLLVYLAYALLRPEKF